MTTTPTNTRKQLTLMFADVCGSTRLYESLGDETAQRKINGLLSALRAEAAQHGGRVIKEIGDESMLVFETADQALALARSLPPLQAEHDLQCKVGIHTGEVIQRDDDVFGDAVNTAARIVSLATPGQVLMSRQTLDLLDQANQPQTRPLPPMAVRGKSQALQLVELAEDQQADYTQVLDNEQIKQLRADFTPALKLNWPGGSLQLNGQDGGISIGREENNKVVLPLPHVSRVHLRIESQGHHWLVQDQSTNGTLVREQGASPLLLRREQHRLLDTGTLHLTPADPEQPAATVKYQVIQPG